MSGTRKTLFRYECDEPPRIGGIWRPHERLVSDDGRVRIDVGQMGPEFHQDFHYWSSIVSFRFWAQGVYPVDIRSFIWTFRVDKERLLQNIAAAWMKAHGATSVPSDVLDGLMSDVSEALASYGPEGAEKNIVLFEP